MTTPDFIRARLDAMIDLRYPLAVLASRMPWVEIESALTPCLARQDRQGRPIEGLDLFGRLCRWRVQAPAQRDARACRSG